MNVKIIVKDGKPSEKAKKMIAAYKEFLETVEVIEPLHKGLLGTHHTIMVDEFHDYFAKDIDVRTSVR